MEELLSIKEASQWASNYLKKDVSPSNISYLLQYGKVKKYTNQGTASVDKSDLVSYYKSYNGQREINWKEQLGGDLNWKLSFDNLKEKDTTKHVHRLHPYKGKFIPQLVEYFLDTYIDEFKTQSYFRKGDIILDPFCGSGTTLVQANELGLSAIGVDISAFNCLISNVKVAEVNFDALQEATKKLSFALKNLISNSVNTLFEVELQGELSAFNKKYFPSPDFKIQVREGKIKEKEYTHRYEQEFLEIYNNLLNKYKLHVTFDNPSNFLETWYLVPVKNEIDFLFQKLHPITDSEIKNVLTIILSRTIRSCRATTHADLATLRKPVTQPYYCGKHGKICKPLFSIYSWWLRYSQDTMARLIEFNALRSSTLQYCMQGDARNIDIIAQLEAGNSSFAQKVRQEKIKGIFSSPPYVGLIDYHEQHAYAYDLFKFKRNDELEIGPLFKGQGLEARKSYIEGISQVLLNAKKYMQENYDVFLVANDKYNMYPSIAEKSGMQIKQTYKRPVLNRTEKDKSAYAEIIFHMKER